MSGKKILMVNQSNTVMSKVSLDMFARFKI